MTWLAEHKLQVMFLAGYLGLLFYHAVHGKRRSRSLDEYMIGGRTFGGITIALSFCATFVSSVTFVGHSGVSFTRGPAWWLTCVCVFTSMIFVAWFVVAPPFYKQARSYNSMTIPDFLGHRYRSMGLRRLAALVVVTASLAYMVAVYDGAVRLLESLTGLGELGVLVAVFLIVTVYTLAGGFHSIVATDVVQGLILFSGGVLLPISMIVKKGGLGPLLDAVRTANPDALSWTSEMPLITMVGLALGIGLKFVVEPRQLSRFYGLSSGEELRRGRWIAPVFLFLIYFCMLPVGFLAHAFVPSVEWFQNADGVIKTDRVVPYLLGEGNILGPVAGAFFLTGLIAAAMSSLDSVLLVAASSVDHDLIAPDRDQKGAMRMTRLWVVMLSGTAALLAWWLDRGIVEMSSFSGSMYAACFLPTLVVSLFWRGATVSGAFAGLILGFLVTLGWFFLKTEIAGGQYKTWHEVYVGIASAMLVFVVVSVCTNPPAADSEA